MRFFLITTIFIQLFSCKPSVDNDGMENKIKSYRKNNFPIRFSCNKIFGTGINRDTFQVYYIWNNSFDTIWLKTVKETGFESLLIKKIYNRDINIKKVGGSEWLHLTSDNSNGFGSIDSIMLFPNKVILFTMLKITRLHFDSITYNLKIKIKNGDIYKDTIVNKKLRLFNNEKYIEDLEFWPSLESN